MGVYNGNLAPGATNQYSSNSDSYLHLYTAATFTVTGVAAIDTRTQAQIDADDPSYIILKLSTSDGNTAQQRIDITGGSTRAYYTANLSISVPENGWVLVDADYVNARVFWRNVQDIVNGGWTGTSTVPTAIGFFDVNFTLNYTNVWDIDGSNDGYPHISGINTIDWQGFEKDEDGYPKNWGVWKLDDQNDGYPWIVGYLPSHVVGGQLSVFTEDSLQPGILYVFTENGLVPASIPIIFT